MLDYGNMVIMVTVIIMRLSDYIGTVIMIPPWFDCSSAFYKEST